MRVEVSGDLSAIVALIAILIALLVTPLGFAILLFDRDVANGLFLFVLAMLIVADLAIAVGILKKVVMYYILGH